MARSIVTGKKRENGKRLKVEMRRQSVLPFSTFTLSPVQSGFHLLELMIVITIVIILAPSLCRIPRTIMHAREAVCCATTFIKLRTLLDQYAADKESFRLLWMI